MEANLKFFTVVGWKGPGGYTAAVKGIPRMGYGDSLDQACQMIADLLPDRVSSIGPAEEQATNAAARWNTVDLAGREYLEMEIDVKTRLPGPFQHVNELHCYDITDRMG